MRDSIASTQRTSTSDQDAASTIKSSNESMPPSIYHHLEMISMHFAFERALKESRVYRRIKAGDCDNSFKSSTVWSHAWSQLSGVSLAHISVVSVIALSLSPEEITNLAHHRSSYSQRTSSYMKTRSKSESVQPTSVNRSISFSRPFVLHPEQPRQLPPEEVDLRPSMACDACDEALSQTSTACKFG